MIRPRKIDRLFSIEGKIERFVITKKKDIHFLDGYEFVEVHYDSNGESASVILSRNHSRTDYLFEDHPTDVRKIMDYIEKNRIPASLR